MRHGDDRAAGFFRLEQVEHFPGTSPEQFGLGQLGEERAARAHDGHRVNAGVGDAASEHGHDRRDCGIKRFGDAPDLGDREERGDVELHAMQTEFLDEREARFALGVGDWNLGVNVGAPRVDHEGLAFHIDDVVGEHLKRDGLGGDGLENVFGEGLVVFDAGLLHEAGVGRQALDVRLGVELENTGFVGTVGVELNLQVVEGFHCVLG